jgi:hypothetical protein
MWPSDPTPEDAEIALDNEDEEVVEIDEQGRIYKPGDAPRTPFRKPSILRDPHGEYSP